MKQDREAMVRKFVRLMGTLLGVLVVSTSLAQEQVQFTGETRADDQLIHTVLQDLALHVRENLKCQSIELVEAEVLADDAVKRDPTQPEGTGPASYEHWTVTYCGKKQPFLVVFWPAKDDGTMYRIQLRPAGGSQ